MWMAKLKHKITGKQTA